MKSEFHVITKLLHLFTNLLIHPCISKMILWEMNDNMTNLECSNEEYSGHLTIFQNTLFCNAMYTHICHYRGKQSDTEKTVVYIGKQHFPGKLCLFLSWINPVFFLSEDYSSRNPYYSLSGNLLSGYYCTKFILFGCLVPLRICRMAVVRFLFDTGNNRLMLQRKQSHTHLFKMRVFIDDMILIRHDSLQT